MNQTKVFPLVKAAAALAYHKNNRASALASLNPNSEAALHLKTASLAGWADYIQARTPAAREFGAHIWEQTVPGQLMAIANNVPAGTQPFNIMGSKAVWIGEGVAAPVVDITVLKENPVQPYKVGSLVVTTRDLLHEAPELQVPFQNAITSAAIKAIDRQFWSDNAGDAVTPAGILKDVVIPGSDFLSTALFTHGKNGNDIKRTALVCGLGYVSGLTIGELTELDKAGIRIIISQYADYPALIDCSKLSINFSGTLITESESAAVEMIKAPTNNSIKPTAAQLVSMFQTNSIAFNAVTYCGWSMPDAGTSAQPSAIAAITRIG